MPEGPTAVEPQEASFDTTTIDRYVTYGPFTVTRERLAAYAAATNETDPDALAGDIATPVFGIVPAWEAVQSASHAVVPKPARPMVVLAGQDIEIIEPVRPGESVVVKAAPVGVHAKRSGTIVQLRAELLDRRGNLLGVQTLTEFVRGVRAAASAGEGAPAHVARGAARTEVREVTDRLSIDQTDRYAAASGDHLPMHIDDEAARAAGLPGRIVHGLCTLAFGARAVVSIAEESPVTVTRLSARFARYALPGAKVATRVIELEPNAGSRRFHFEIVGQDGHLVLREGIAELTKRKDES